MSRDLEIEAKFLVSQTDFEKILQYFGVYSQDFKAQTNYYFDTENFDLVKKNNSVLRIRQVNLAWEATLKLPLEGKIMEINQKNIVFNPVDFNFTQLPEIVPYIDKIGINLRDLKIRGVLQTNRARLPYMGGELFFDISSYNEVIDYEIEYEVLTTIHEANYVLTKLFNELNIHNYQPSPSKVKRCLNIKD